jgi:hypothetical protein
LDELDDFQHRRAAALIDVRQRIVTVRFQENFLPSFEHDGVVAISGFVVPSGCFRLKPAELVASRLRTKTATTFVSNVKFATVPLHSTIAGGFFVVAMTQPSRPAVRY